MWPGYGENSRVLKWIFENLEGADNATPTPIGWLPKPEAIDTEGLDLAPNAMLDLLEVNVEVHKRETRSIRQYYQMFGQRLPQELSDELDNVRERLALQEVAQKGAQSV